MIFAFGSFEEVKFYETGLVFQIGVSGIPDFLKFGFLTFDDTKAVHGNVRHNMQNEGSGGEGKKGYFYCFVFMTQKCLCKSLIFGMD